MNYLARIMTAAKNGAVPPGDLALVQVQHDDDCRIWSGRPCSCLPDLVLDGKDGRIYILEDGAVARGEA